MPPGWTASLIDQILPVLSLFDSLPAERLDALVASALSLAGH
jgi:hypothetical protein